MRNQHFLGGLLIVFLIVVTSGCGSVRRGEPITGVQSASEPAIAQGRSVFQQHCHQCHPGGEGGLGPSLNDKPAPGFLIKTQVRAGLGVMPCFDTAQISSEELADLTSFLLDLRKADENQTT